jgi:hypothetical protein
MAKSKFDKDVVVYSAARRDMERDKKKRRFAHEDLKTKTPRRKTQVIQDRKKHQDKLDMERPLNKLWTAAGTAGRKWNKRYRRAGRAVYELTH